MSFEKFLEKNILWKIVAIDSWTSLYDTLIDEKFVTLSIDDLFIGRS